MERYLTEADGEYLAGKIKEMSGGGGGECIDYSLTWDEETKSLQLANGTATQTEELTGIAMSSDLYDDTALAGRVTTLENAGYQTAAQVEAKITDELASFDKLDYVVADSKPTAANVVIDGETVDTVEGIRYLVETGGTFEEYVLLDGTVYDFGSTGQIDLTGYATETYVDGQISEHVKTDVPENAVFTDTKDLASMTGTLPVSKGGTGRTTLTSGSLLVGNGTGNVAYRSIVTTVSNSTSIPTAGAVQTALDAKADATDLTDLEERVEGIEEGTTDYHLHITDAEVKEAFEGAAGTSVNNTYSTEEQRIGTWIDGKPVYRKLINVGTIAKNTTKTINYGATVDLIIDTRLIFFDAQTGTIGTTNVVLPSAQAADYGVFVTGRVSNSCNIQTGSNIALTKSYLIIEYTKA